MHIAVLGPIHSGDYAEFLDFPDDQRPGPTGAPFIATLVKALIGLGHRITIVTTDRMMQGKARHLTGRIDFHVCPARLYATRPNGLRLGKAMDFFAAERKAVVDVLQQVRPDVVHAHWAYEYSLAAIDSRLPALVTVHDSPLDVFRLDKTAYNILRILMARRSVHRAMKLAAVSPYIEQRIRESFGRTVDYILPNPLPVDIIERVRAKSPIRHTKTFVYVCNYWSKLKAPEIALAAFAQVRARHPSARLVCLGRDFAAGGPAMSWATRNGLADGVEFHGHQSHEQALLQVASAACLLHTSRNESFGMAAAEAMALGTPVIADANAGALPWLLADGAAGALVDTRNVEKVVAAMCRIVDDVASAAAQASFGERRVVELCDPALLARATVQALGSLLQPEGVGAYAVE